MSSKKTAIWIIVAIVALVLTLMSLVYEIREVPDVKWERKYDFDDENPYGYRLFSELVEELYDVEVIRADTSVHLDHFEGNQKVLYIKLTNGFIPDSAYVDEISSFLENGHDMLLLSRYLGGNLKEVLQQQDYNIYGWQDTSVNVRWVDSNHGIVDTTSMRYVNYYDDFRKGRNYNFRYLSKGATDSLITDDNWIATDNDNDLIYGYFLIDSCLFYIHVIPELFTNVALKQDDMLRHFEQSMSYFDPDIIVLDNQENEYSRKLSEHRRGQHSRTITADENPMDYVLAQPSLKWAYYLMVLSMLLYALLRSRRRQKVIPVLPRYDNTSLDHVQMLADLYESQQQHNKLIGHMRQLFYHRIEQRYYLKPTAKDYVVKLSQKSKVPQEEIEILLNRFDTVPKSKKMSAYDLNVFYKTLQRFYDKCK